jgi:Bacterial PH domain
VRTTSGGGALRGGGRGSRRPRAPRRPRQPPKRVKDRLAAGERLLIDPLRQHPIVLLKPTVIVLAGLVVLYGVSLLNPPSLLFGVVGFAWLVLLGWGVIQWIEHYVDWIVITQKRVVRVSGIIPGVAMLPIGRVTDFKYERDLLGALLGYGTFILESAGQVQALRELEYIREPNLVYETITAAIYATE